MNVQAAQQNQVLQKANPVLYELLSARGKEIFLTSKDIPSQAAEANGKKINATIGMATEDDHSPMRLDCLSEKIQLKPEQVFPYTSPYGKEELRKLWQAMMREKNPLLGQKPISLPVVTNAITHGLSLCGYLFVDPGDGLLLPDLFWENYRFVFSYAYGARLESFETFRGNGFNVEGLREKLAGSGQKKLLLLNFPNNPTGYSPTKGEVAAIIEVIGQAARAGQRLVVIMDDAYFGLVFGQGIYRESLFAPLADLHPHVLAIKIDGATKEDYAWGFRVGFLTYGYRGITPEVCAILEEKTAAAIRGNISSIAHPSQSLLLTAFRSPSYKQQKQRKFEILRSRYQAVVEVLQAHREYAEYFDPLPFNSGYFMCVKLKGIDAEAVRQCLLQSYNTGVIALGSLVRVAFSSLSREQIPEMFNNVYQACREVQQRRT